MYVTLDGADRQTLLSRALFYDLAVVIACRLLVGMLLT